MDRKLLLPSLLIIFLLSAILSPRVDFDFLGQVNLQDKESKAFDLMSKSEKNCSDSGSRTEYIVCYIKNISPGVERYGISPFVKVLENKFLESKSTIYGGMSRCHDIAHAIGQTGVKYYDSRSTVSECSSICGAGCFHGAMEGYLATGKNLEQSLQTLCKSADEQFNRTRWACFHGLGHGIASLVGEPKKSLETCDLIADPEGIANCTYGVFMELYQSSSFGHSRLPAPKDMLSFCSELWGEHKKVCFYNAGLQEYLNTEDTQRARDVCASSPLEFRSGCFSHLGNLIYHILQGDAQGVLSFCAEFGEGRRECIKGALQESVNTDFLARDGLEICSLIEEELSKECYEQVGQRVLAAHGRQARETACSGLVQENKEACLKGTGSR